jgi:hypothetical protein
VFLFADLVGLFQPRTHIRIDFRNVMDPEVMDMVAR